jgi:hypothetical protein
MRQLIFQTKILWKPSKGIYLYRDYYDNGDIEEREVPEGPVIFPTIIYPY